MTSLTSFSINNILISDNVLKYQINSSGITLHNGATYDVFRMPYIRYGLHFNLKTGESLEIDAISDEEMQDIIIPNNSYLKSNELLTTKPINNVSFTINKNVRYIRVCDNIENLTIKYDKKENEENKKIIMSIPNKKFDINLDNITITNLILRDYNNETFNYVMLNKITSSSITNLTINSSILLFNKYNLSLIDNLVIDKDDYYKYLMIQGMHNGNKSMYMKKYEIKEIDELNTYDNVISNINLGAKIENNKVIFYRCNDTTNSFEIETTCTKVLIYEHYALLYNNEKWYEYDLFDKTLSPKETYGQYIIEINGSVYSYAQDEENDVIKYGDKTFPIITNSTLLLFIRCFNTLIAFCYVSKKLYAVYSDTNAKCFFSNIIADDYDSDYESNFTYYFSFKDNNLIIEYKTTSTTTSSTYKQLIFKAYNIDELFIKF